MLADLFAACSEYAGMLANESQNDVMCYSSCGGSLFRDTLHACTSGLLGTPLGCTSWVCDCDWCAGPISVCLRHLPVVELLLQAFSRYESVSQKKSKLTIGSTQKSVIGILDMHGLASIEHCNNSL